MSAVFKREFKAYFQTPVGFIFLAAFYFFLGFYFTIIYSAGSPDVTTVLVAMSTIIVFAVPLLTMRLMSEDRRLKVDQVLLTAPVRLTGIVFGKFFAALAVYALAFLPGVIFEIITAVMVSVNPWAFLYTMLGILLLGGALIAMGMFISSLTESTAISAILTLVINILVLYMSNFSEMISVGWLSKIVEKAAFITVFENFGNALFSVTDVVYFLSIIAAFLFLSVRSLDKRRWA